MAELLRSKAKEAKEQRETLDPRGHAENPAEFYERSLMFKVREMVWGDCASFLTDEEVFEEEFEEAEDGA